MSRIVMIVFLGAFVFGGCAPEKYQLWGDTRREYGVQKIQTKYPQWDENTVQKVASKRVEIGMTPEMVRASLGEPDTISGEGDQQRWGYATYDAGFDFAARKRLVYFVFFEDAKVVRTAGDRSKLPYAQWEK